MKKVLAYAQYLKKIWTIVARPQIAVVFLAFALMVSLSSWFIGNIFRKHLIDNAQAVLDSLETNIKVDLLEPRTVLGNISQTIRTMIIEGDSAAMVNRYLREITDSIQSGEEQQLSGFSGLYGFFDVFGELLPDRADIKLPENYEPTERPWYREAVAAGGGIVFLQPYADIATTSVVITHARALFDDEGQLLGAVALDLRLDRISEYISGANLGSIGNGVMLSENMEILAHPEPDFLGKNFGDLSSDYPALVQKLRQEHTVTEFRMKKYNGVSSVFFIRRLENGWFIGVVTPEEVYYRELGRIRFILIILGIMLASGLSAILLNIVAARDKADERMRVMFNTMPLGASYHDRNFNFLDCNQSIMNLFGLSNKQEYFDRFYDLLPEYQPDGRPSRETADELVRKTFADGYCRFEWLHQNLSGEPIPCEMVLVRVMHKDDFMIIAYTRDLREIRHRENLLNTVNSVANVLLSVKDEKLFETSLIKSFELVGNCLDVDRVQIWRNEVIDGELHFVNRYEWLSEYGRNSAAVPIGLHFPYSLKPKWKSLFLRGAHINTPLSGLPEDDQAFLSSYGMKSIVIIPMFLEDNFWGFFSIGDYRR
jgi:PAS domain-containing protein